MTARHRRLARSASYSRGVFQSPGPCPQCERADLVRKGGKDQCPVCFYLQPCCDGGDLCGPGWDDAALAERPRTAASVWD